MNDVKFVALPQQKDVVTQYSAVLNSIFIENPHLLSLMSEKI